MSFLVFCRVRLLTNVDVDDKRDVFVGHSVQINPAIE